MNTSPAARRWTDRVAPGRLWAYLGLAIGLGISLAANEQAVYLSNPDPQGIDQLIAALPPAAAFIAIEVLIHNPWPLTLVWRRTVRAIAWGVAIPSTVVSFVHLAHLSIVHQGVTFGNGLDPDEAVALLVAFLTPLMIDGLLAASTAALMIPAAAVSRETSSAVALRDVRIITRTMPVYIDRVVEKVVEKVVEGPERIVIKKVPAPTVESVRTSAPQKRFRAEQHPLWPAWRSDLERGQPWSAERMQKELQAWGSPDATAAAARSLINRWTNRHQELST